MPFYLRAVAASVDWLYWSQPAQNWTTNPDDATLFESREDAERERRHAEYGPFEAEVCQKAVT